MNKVVNSYLEGKTIYEVGELYNVHPEAVRRILIKNNIPRRTRQENAQYQYDRSFFKEIDTPEKAYFLGFIVADGHIRLVSDKNYILEIGLNPKDKEVLEDFADILGASHQLIRPFMKGRGVRIILSSYEICKDLIKLGVPLKDKSNSAKTINCGKFAKDFWRGVFDGDGGVWISKDKKTFRYSLCGTKDICKGFKQFMSFGAQIRVHSGIFEIQSGFTNKNTVENFYKILYYDNCICLKRKKEVFEVFLN